MMFRILSGLVLASLISTAGAVELRTEIKPKDSLWQQLNLEAVVHIEPGTGTLIHRCFVLTARHVVVDRVEHDVKVAKEGVLGRKLVAKLGYQAPGKFKHTVEATVVDVGLTIATMHDWALLQLATCVDDIKPMPITTQRPKSISVVGFPGAFNFEFLDESTMVISDGPVYDAPLYGGLAASAYASGGQSGGPVITPQGELFGILTDANLSFLRQRESRSGGVTFNKIENVIPFLEQYIKQ